MAELQWGNVRPIDIAGSIQQGYAVGTQMKQQRQAEQDQNALRALAPGVIGGDPNALTQAATIDPTAAGKYDAVGVDIAKRGTGAATYLLDAVKRGNPQEIEGRYQAVRPFLEKVGAAQGKVPPPNFDPAMIPLMEQLVARSQGMGGGKEDQVQSTRIGADGFYYTVDRTGNWTNSGIKADPRTQLRDAPGVAPGIVDLRTGAVSGLQAGGTPAPASAPAMAPGEVPFAIDPSLPANVQADIRSRQGAYAAAAEGNGVVPSGPAPAATGGGNQFQTTSAVVDGPAAVRPAVSPVEAERLRLAQEANARATEAAARAARAEDRSARGNAPAGFRFREDGSLEPIPGGPKPAGAAATEGERKAATLLRRMDGSLSQLEAAVKADPNAAAPAVGASVAGSIFGETARNAVNTSERQRVESAQLDILDAALTLGTGAAYTKEQLEGYRRSFFPQLGDTEDNVRDKSARLQNVIQAARIAAGRAAPEATAAAEPQGAPRRLKFNPATGRIE